MRLSLRGSAACLLFALSLAAAAQATSGWMTTWAPANVRLEDATAAGLPLGQREITLRQVVHVSQGGRQIRLVLSNEFGEAPLRIDAVHLAFQSSGSRILTATDHVLSFAGQSSVTIAPGATATSDAVSLVLPIFSDLVLTFDLPAQPLQGITVHPEALTTTYLAEGNRVAAEELLSPEAVPPGLGKPDVTAPVMSSDSVPQGSMPVVSPAGQPARNTAIHDEGGVTQTSSWYFLKRIEVDAPRGGATVAAFGDSITDGYKSTPETNRRYPDMLAPLLAAGKKTGRLAVANLGLSANRTLVDGYGPSALHRFERDVLSQPGLCCVILLEGTNDLRRPSETPVTAQALVDGLTELANRAHARGVRVWVGTLPPFAGSPQSSAEANSLREAVNGLLRNSRAFDHLVDFDAALRDPADPTRLLPKFDSGDHLHPNDAGYEKMAGAVDLKSFRKR